MTDQFPYPPHVEVAVTARDAMNVDQIVAQGVGTRHIQSSEFPGLRNSLQIEKVSVAFRIFGQQEKFLRRAERDRCSAARECANVERANVPGQAIESIFLPE